MEEGLLLVQDLVELELGQAMRRSRETSHVGD